MFEVLSVVESPERTYNHKRHANDEQSLIDGLELDAFFLEYKDAIEERHQGTATAHSTTESSPAHSQRLFLNE